MSNKIPANIGSAKVAALIGATITSSTTSDSLVGTDKYSALVLHLKLASVTGTSPTFNCYLQQLSADGATWYDIASLAQQTSAGSTMLGMVSGGNSTFSLTDGTLTANTIKSVPFGGTQRVKIVVAGTNPSAIATVNIEYIQ